MAAPEGGFLTRPIAEMQNSGFFNWFNLGETQRKPVADGGQKIDFQPTGDKFHDLVRVVVTVNSAMAVRRMDLVLQRSFVDNPANGIFASDIAKSFVADVPARDDCEVLQTLVAEIQYRATSSQPVIVGPGHSPPELPNPPTAAYQAYAGKRRKDTKDLSHCTFGIQNEHPADSDQLHIYFIAK